MRVAACSVLVAAVVGVYAACGLTVIATGGPLLDGAVPRGGDGAIGDGGRGRTDGADAAQGECTGARQTCGPVCTDVKADSLNCGMCGKICGDGETCEDGGCTVLCVADTMKCNNSCVDSKTDPRHCGTCPNQCAVGLFCSAGQCATDCGALSTCALPDAGADAGPLAVYCADETTDHNNCGACGKVCKPNEICTASACKAVCAPTTRVGDVLAPNMVGCVAKVSFESRAGVCPGGAAVCTAQEWVTRHGAKKPTYNYWTNDDLAWSGSDGNCIASTTRGQLCGAFTPTPMRVCGAKTDPVGNLCNYTNCGYDNAAQPNQFFGGCENNPTSGALCCTP